MSEQARPTRRAASRDATVAGPGGRESRETAAGRGAPVVPVAAGGRAGTARSAAVASAAAGRHPDLRLAAIHLRSGMLALARVELETAAGRGSLDDPGLLDLAEARWRTGDLRGAASAAESWLEAAGPGMGARDEAVAHVILAEAAAARGRDEDVGRHAATALGALGSLGAGAADAGLHALPGSAPASQRRRRGTGGPSEDAVAQLLESIFAGIPPQATVWPSVARASAPPLQATGRPQPSLWSVGPGPADAAPPAGATLPVSSAADRTAAEPRAAERSAPGRGTRGPTTAEGREADDGATGRPELVPEAPGRPASASQRSEVAEATEPGAPSAPGEPPAPAESAVPAEPAAPGETAATREPAVPAEPAAVPEPAGQAAAAGTSRADAGTNEAAAAMLRTAVEALPADPDGAAIHFMLALRSGADPTAVLAAVGTDTSRPSLALVRAEALTAAGRHADAAEVIADARRRIQAPEDAGPSPDPGG